MTIEQPATVTELPRMFGKPDPKISEMLDSLKRMNDAGEIDSMVVVTTSYGHVPQIRRRLGHTATTLLGALLHIALGIAQEANQTPINDEAG